MNSWKRITFLVKFGSSVATHERSRDEGAWVRFWWRWCFSPHVTLMVRRSRGRVRPAVLKPQGIFLFPCWPRFDLTLYFFSFFWRGEGPFNRTFDYKKVKLIFQSRKGF